MGKWITKLRNVKKKGCTRPKRGKEGLQRQIKAEGIVWLAASALHEAETRPAMQSHSQQVQAWHASLIIPDVGCHRTPMVMRG